MKENCERLLAHYKKCMDDSSLSEQARLNAKLAHADMLKNMANDPRFAKPKTVKK